MWCDLVQSATQSALDIPPLSAGTRGQPPPHACMSLETLSPISLKAGSSDHFESLTSTSVSPHRPWANDCAVNAQPTACLIPGSSGDSGEVAAATVAVTSPPAMPGPARKPAPNAYPPLNPR